MGDTFTMRCGYETKAVPCVFVGPLAVHKCDWDWRRGKPYWRVSHVRTGYYVDLWGRTRKEAIAVAEAANKAYPEWGKLAKPPVICGRLHEKLCRVADSVRQQFPHLKRDIDRW